MTTRTLSVFRPMLCVAICAAAATATLPVRAAEDPSPMMNVVELSGKGAVQVQQDMLRMVLETTRDGSDAAAVQSTLKQALDQALQVARPQAAPGRLDVRTGAFSLYPLRDAKGRITGWQGRAQLILEGTDIARISSLSGRIHSMTVSDIGFDLSPAARRKAESQAQEEAIADFRARASTIAHSFGFQAYTVREVAVRADNGGLPRPYMARMAVASTRAVDDATPMPVEPGATTVQVTASGAVRMH